MCARPPFSVGEIAASAKAAASSARSAGQVIRAAAASAYRTTVWLKGSLTAVLGRSAWDDADPAGAAAPGKAVLPRVAVAYAAIRQLNASHG